MCTTHLYTTVFPDGRRDEARVPALCSASRHGLPCADNVLLQHPVRYGHGRQQLPPSPPTQRSPAPALRARSGSGSRSRPGSRSCSCSRPRRHPGVYINGQRVVDLEGRRRERIVLVDTPPRTPPRIFAAPHTAPPSPAAAATAPHMAPHMIQPHPPPPPPPPRRPVVVVDQSPRPHPRVHFEQVVETRHRRQSSDSSSRDTWRSHTIDDDVDKGNNHHGRRGREQQRRESRDRELRQQRLREQIALANAEIDSRPAVPLPSPPRRSSHDRRETELIESVRRLDLEDRRWSARRAAEAETRAQFSRLRERMMPPGGGRHRQRVLYDDGIYRWG